MTDHKATPEQWAMLEERSAPEYDNTILELRARVEALEANAKPTSNLSQIRSSLVERVADAIAEEATTAGIVNDRPARAAIREVAAWLQKYFNGPVASSKALEREAER